MGRGLTDKPLRNPAAKGHMGMGLTSEDLLWAFSTFPQQFSLKSSLYWFPGATVTN